MKINYILENYNKNLKGIASHQFANKTAIKIPAQVRVVSNASNNINIKT